ncbi:hypothetical protein [Flammeovirga agarivorans]|uniref:Uncharacterized protein n=1 Tax=Flammeovirga agarivorans TaxID=2726742 RepID=A0A7X8SIS8_9BACT|nr:hypothetical protein [Flammeovirga agarivorans]NLR90863.1 hypothetical protein [Flammeovirga agarivorans]
MGNSKNESASQDIDWDALEAEDNKNSRSKQEEKVDVERINAEKKKLSNEERSNPYPDDFLAEINIIRDDYDDMVEKGEINANNSED